MNTVTQNCLTSLRLGEAQSHRNVLVFPLISPPNGDCNWHTLGEAIESGALSVTEISQGGSVPELKVINKGGRPVLLIDGEELIGAKQNRVLNTTILLKENSETVVPVSCVEQHRWSYSSANFSSSELVMSRKSRARKSSSVSESLAANFGYKSDQGEVWHEVAALHASVGTASPTGAMHDAFKAYESQLQQCLSTFTSVPGQTGLLVIVDGEVAGFDLIPHARLYAREHAKLIKSYVIDALTVREPKPVDVALARIRAEEFLRAVSDSDEQQFASIGYGTDYRFKKNALAGTSLVHADEVVHTAFFNLSGQQAYRPAMASQLRRRRYTLGPE